MRTVHRVHTLLPHIPRGPSLPSQSSLAPSGPSFRTAVPLLCGPALELQFPSFVARFRTLFLTWPSLPSLTPSARLRNPGFLAPSGPGLKFISPGLLSGLQDPLPPLQKPPFLTPSGSRIRTPSSSYPFRVKDHNSLVFLPLQGQGSELPCLLIPSGSRITTPLSSYPFRVKDQNSLVFLTLAGSSLPSPSSLCQGHLSEPSFSCTFRAPPQTSDHALFVSDVCCVSKLWPGTGTACSLWVQVAVLRESHLGMTGKRTLPQQ